jgi:hypothetical protein
MIFVGEFLRSDPYLLIVITGHLPFFRVAALTVNKIANKVTANECIFARIAHLKMTTNEP